MSVPITVNGVPYRVEADRVNDVAYIIDVHRRVGGPFTLQEENYSIQTPFWQDLYANDFIYGQVFPVDYQKLHFTPMPPVPVFFYPSFNTIQQPLRPIVNQEPWKRERAQSGFVQRTKAVKTRDQKLSQTKTKWLFVGNISYRCSKQKIEHLAAKFAQFGEIEIFFPRVSEGRIWLKFKEEKAAFRALKKMDQQVFEDRTLFVDFSRCPKRCTERPRAMSMV